MKFTLQRKFRNSLIAAAAVVSSLGWLQPAKAGNELVGRIEKVQEQVKKLSPTTKLGHKLPLLSKLVAFANSFANVGGGFANAYPGFANAVGPGTFANAYPGFANTWANA